MTAWNGDPPMADDPIFDRRDRDPMDDFDPYDVSDEDEDEDEDE